MRILHIKFKAALTDPQSLALDIAGFERLFFRNKSISKLHLEYLFSCFDVEGKGHVSFAEFALSLDKLINCDPENVVLKLMDAFQISKNLLHSFNRKQFEEFLFFYADISGKSIQSVMKSIEEVYTLVENRNLDSKKDLEKVKMVIFSFFHFANLNLMFKLYRISQL